jgi:hypothetical protein
VEDAKLRPPAIEDVLSHVWWDGLIHGDDNGAEPEP